MIENAYQHFGERLENGFYSRKADVDFFQVEFGFKKMRSQNGRIIELQSKKVTLSDKSKFSAKENLVEKKTHDVNLAFFNKCSEIILKHYSETPTMVLSSNKIIYEIKEKLGGIGHGTFYLYLKKLGLNDVLTSRELYKKQVIFPFVFEAIKSMNYKCKVREIVSYLNDNGFEKTTGIKANKSFIISLIKNNCKREFKIQNNGKTDWEEILNDKA